MSERGSIDPGGVVSAAWIQPRRWPSGVSVAFGILGALELLLVYVVVRSRLPSSIPWHYGPTGQPNGSVPPLLVLGLDLSILSLVTIAFAAILWWGARSVPLVTQFRGRLTWPLLVLQAALGVGILPLVFGLLFVQASVGLGASTLGVEILLTLLGALTASVILLSPFWGVDAGCEL